MTDMTARLALPLLQPGQAQKELFHNEALAIVDAALHPVAESVGTTAPPATPAAGTAWIVGAGAAGAWSGHDHALAIWTEGGWRFVALPPGALVHVRADDAYARRTGDGWTVGILPLRRVIIGGVQVVGAQVAGIGAPTGGATVDGEARSTISAILNALARHGLIAAQ